MSSEALVVLILQTTIEERGKEPAETRHLDLMGLFSHFFAFCTEASLHPHMVNW